jgi:hypothetical protein
MRRTCSNPITFGRSSPNARWSQSVLETGRDLSGPWQREPDAGLAGTIDGGVEAARGSRSNRGRVGFGANSRVHALGERLWA